MVPWCRVARRRPLWWHCRPVSRTDMQGFDQQSSSICDFWDCEDLSKMMGGTLDTQGDAHLACVQLLKLPPRVNAWHFACADGCSAYPGEPGKMTVWKPGLWGAAAARIAWPPAPPCARVQREQMPVLVGGVCVGGEGEVGGGQAWLVILQGRGCNPPCDPTRDGL